MGQIHSSQYLSTSVRAPVDIFELIDTGLLFFLSFIVIQVCLLQVSNFFVFVVTNFGMVTEVL